MYLSELHLFFRHQISAMSNIYFWVINLIWNAVNVSETNQVFLALFAKGLKQFISLKTYLNPTLRTTWDQCFLCLNLKSMAPKPVYLSFEIWIKFEMSSCIAVCDFPSYESELCEILEPNGTWGRRCHRGSFNLPSLIVGPFFVAVIEPRLRITWSTFLISLLLAWLEVAYA